MRVEQIGPNQSEIELGGARVLVSYSTPVAAWLPGEGYIRTRQKHSPTTTRHVNSWLAGAEAKQVPQSRFDTLLGG